jgi:hypothetical protein
MSGMLFPAIAMRWNDFVKMVNPIVGRFAE